MKLCKSNVTKVLKKAGFGKSEMSVGGYTWTEGFEVLRSWLVRDVLTVVHRPSFESRSEGDEPEKLSAMTSTLSPYWTVTPVEGGLQLSEKEG